MINEDIHSYCENEKLSITDKQVCKILCSEIDKNLPKNENKLWHGHPVWFLNGNPVAGISKEKIGVRLMFWSGASFGEEMLSVRGGKFQDASVFYNELDEINLENLLVCLQKAQTIQWDYKNIVKRKGVLEKLTEF